MRYYTPLATLAMALTFAACSQEAIDEPVIDAPGNVHITLSAPFNSGQPLDATESRAPQSAGYTAEVDKKRELIESYYVVFTQTTGGTETIVRVVSEDDVRTAAGNGIESKRLDLELREGTYKVYAFANMPFVDTTADTDTDADELVLGPNTTLDLGEGESINASDLANASYLFPFIEEGKSYVPVESVDAVPMTSLSGQEINVTERANQTFGIEVVRMLGKVQFDFTNPTTTPLNIHGIKMSDLTANNSSTVLPKRDGATKLMNYYDFLYTGHNSGANSFIGTPISLPTGTTTASLEHDYTTPELLSLPADGGTESASFYVLESQAKDYPVGDPLHGTFVDNAFQLDFNIKPTTTFPEGDELRYAVTTPDNFTTIHRNDWIVIPVTIGEWVMRLVALSYPPIGGYPEAKVDADNTGNFHVAFSSPGDISFMPAIHKYYSTTEYFYLNDPVRIVSRTLEIGSDTPAGFFTKEPTFDPTSGEYIATLGGVKGSALLTLTVRFTTTAGEKEIKSKIVVEHI